MWCTIRAKSNEPFPRRALQSWSQWLKLQIGDDEATKECDDSCRDHPLLTNLSWYNPLHMKRLDWSDNRNSQCSNNVMTAFVRSPQNDTQSVSLRHFFAQYVDLSSSSSRRGCGSNFVDKLLRFVCVPSFATRTVPAATASRHRW